MASIITLFRAKQDTKVRRKLHFLRIPATDAGTRHARKRSVSKANFSFKLQFNYRGLLRA